MRSSQLTVSSSTLSTSSPTRNTARLTRTGRARAIRSACHRMLPHPVERLEQALVELPQVVAEAMVRRVDHPEPLGLPCRCHDASHFSQGDKLVLRGLN